MYFTAIFLFIVAAAGQTNEGDSCVDQYTNSVGICTNAEKCRSAKEDFQKNGINPTFCKYSAFGTTTVCCRDRSTILQTAPPNRDDFKTLSTGSSVGSTLANKLRSPTRLPIVANIATSTQNNKWKRPAFPCNLEGHLIADPMIGRRPTLSLLCHRAPPVWGAANAPDNRRVSERKCEQYSKGVTEVVDFIPLLPNPETMSISSAKCDYAGVELIVGGEAANQGEFPHMAAIGFTNFNNGYSFSCGGSLISPKFVLTAGHCTRDPTARDPEPVIVRLGDHNIDPTVNDGAQPVDVAIRKIHKHPAYNPPSKYNDIALLELATDVEFKAAIRPACLWTQPGFGGHKKAVATGWGVVDAATKETSNELLKVSLTLLENRVCGPLLGKIRNWEGFVDSQMCAGELRGGKDTCQGDSGSPLQIANKENQCIFYVIGVTSFGKRCAQSGIPAIYSRVSSYLDWIEKVVWPGE